MTACRYVKFFRHMCLRDKIFYVFPYQITNFCGGRVGPGNGSHIIVRRKHGSGRGSRRGQPSIIKEHATKLKKPTVSPLPTSASDVGDHQGTAEQDDRRAGVNTGHVNEFDSQYFSGIIDEKQSDFAAQAPDGADHNALEFELPVTDHLPTHREESLNEFDSHYFSELTRTARNRGRPARSEKRRESTSQTGSHNQPGRSIRGHFMFHDIDAQFFDDINSSFVYEHEGGKNGKHEEEDSNEFDRQYFGNETMGSTLVNQNQSFEKNESVERFIDTSRSEEDMFKQYHLNRRDDAEEGSHRQVKRSSNGEKGFKAHEKASNYKEVPGDEFGDHREVHVITTPEIDPAVLDMMPAELRGKLIANRMWHEQKDELKVGNHNLQDLESSVVSALEKVKKKRNKKNRSKVLKAFGSEDEDIPISNVACSGCGAFLHCKDNTRPGFLPREKFVELDPKKPSYNEVCQRCWYLIHHQTALNVSLPEENYLDIIKAIRKNRKALIILMVDLLDFPCSIIKDLKTQIGSSRPFIIVGNKLDVLPQDELKYQKRIKAHLLSSCIEMGVCETDMVRYVGLISAKSGYGIEELISKIYSLRPASGDVYLLGTANVGKSTLFNVLVESDLCQERAAWLMGRATVSRWPGTTLNLLRFPLLRPSRERLALRSGRLAEERAKRAKEEAKQKAEKEKRRGAQSKNLEEELKDVKITEYVTGSVARTTKPVPDEVEEEYLAEEYLAKEEEGEEDPFSLKLAAPQIGTNRTKKSGAGKERGTAVYNPKDFKSAGWFYDTPGVIYKDQVLTFLSDEELKLVVPKRGIVPRSLILKPGQTFYLGGLGRLDYIQGQDSVYFTVFSSNALPIKVLATEEAEEVYRQKAGSKYFVVPQGGRERMESFPDLLPTDFSLRGLGRHMSLADILFSSAGWAGITANKDMDLQLRAFTPGGQGCILRTPALLPYAFSLRGPRRSRSSPFYNISKTKLLQYSA